MLRRAATTVLAVAFGAGVLIAAPAVAHAQGYAGGTPSSVPPGSFPTVVATTTLGSTGGSITTSWRGAGLDLTIPPGALPSGTQVTIAAGSDSVLAGYLPAGTQIVDAFAIGWLEPNGSSPNAALPLVFKITDQGITASATLWETSDTGVAPTGPPTGTETTGSATFQFLNDPGFLVTLPPASPNGTIPSGPPNTGGGAGAGTSGQQGAMLPALPFLVVLMMAAGLARAKRRAPAPSV